MPVGVMGQKDWDEHLPKKEIPIPVIYTSLKQYAMRIEFSKEEWNELCSRKERKK